MPANAGSRDAPAAERLDTDALLVSYRRSRDRNMRNQIVEAHLHLVDPYVRKLSGRGIATDDLRQAGFVALIRAVERFDPDVGVTLGTFAGRTIEGELKRLLRDRGWAVRPPRRQQEAFLAIRRVEEDLTQTLGRSPTVSELATSIGQDEDVVIEALEAGAARHANSIDHPATADGMAPTAWLGTHDRELGRVEVRLLVAELLEALDDRSREVIELRFFEELGQPEIAARLGLSQSYVSRLIRRVLSALEGAASDEVRADVTGEPVESVESVESVE